MQPLIDRFHVNFQYNCGVTIFFLQNEEEKKNKIICSLINIPKSSFLVFATTCLVIHFDTVNYGMEMDGLTYK